MPKRRIPPWWGWPLTFPRHVKDRMRQRGFSETDVRHMLFSFRALRPSADVGRWIVDAELEQRPWRIVLEPDHQQREIVVVTAYPAEPTR